jgi:hypothetical protein
VTTPPTVFEPSKQRIRVSPMRTSTPLIVCRHNLLPEPHTAGRARPLTLEISHAYPRRNLCWLARCT